MACLLRVCWILFYGVVGYFGASWLGQMILESPTSYPYPLIFLVTFISAYAFRSSLFDVWVMLIAGLFGWLMRRFEFNSAAFIISFVLAGGAEEAFRQSLRLSDTGVLIFVQRPIATGFLILGLLAVVVRARALNKQSKPQE